MTQVEGAADNSSSMDNNPKIEIIKEVFKQQYGEMPPPLSTLIRDVIDLYEGRWSTHQACQVSYHNLHHAIDVTLLTAQITAGWNIYKGHTPLPREIFICGLIAALFHDSGYIKERGDISGRGGKYTFRHEERSINNARVYLSKHCWPNEFLKLVPRIISVTEFNRDTPIDNNFPDHNAEIMAKILATSDLVAQMADVNYIQQLNSLYEEMKEAYEFEGTENLARKGIRIFLSAKEMVDETMGFYEYFVLPRLQRFGRMDQYLVTFFGNGRNPYLENIAANLSGQLMNRRVQWRRLGEIFEELGVVTPEQLKLALARQQEKKLECSPHPRRTKKTLHEQLMAWMDNSQCEGSCLGDLLMEMKLISPANLRKGLLDQILPPLLIEQLSREELVFILKISVLLQNINRGPWVFHQILEMTNELLHCEASSILLTNDETKEMLVVIPTGPKKDIILNSTISTERGLAGWVYRHGQPAVVRNVTLDERFDEDFDRRLGFTTRSILAVPLHINGEIIGVMEVVNKDNDNFTIHDMDILTMLANVIAISLVGALNRNNS
ncbi:MAG: hypothetical protein A2511_05315 [Deltaproteobacteria bacterium RIFOXYD12_FULL_50_9]|nr:MAG: hypothetical protein A2511_05315 [Deltaproteobacteria bacterium RIFOXYD12_FULL_50_9]